MNVDAINFADVNWLVAFVLVFFIVLAVAGIFKLQMKDAVEELEFQKVEDNSDG